MCGTFLGYTQENSCSHALSSSCVVSFPIICGGFPRHKKFLILLLFLSRFYAVGQISSSFAAAATCCNVVMWISHLQQLTPVVFRVMRCKFHLHRLYLSKFFWIAQVNFLWKKQVDTSIIPGIHHFYFFRTIITVQNFSN